MGHRHSIMSLAFSMLGALACSMAMAQSCSRQSPRHTVALVELYTSEGCSSCPPADRWLSGLGKSGVGADEVIPLALHVDYWDALGWKDRFADSRFSERQRALSRLAGRRVVYTPEVFLNLREFGGWDSAAQFRQAVKAINARPAGADIRLTLGAASRAQLPVRASFAVKSGAAPVRAQAFIVVYEDRLSTPVAAGENRGATLRHDHVVRHWAGPLELRGGSAEFDAVIALDPRSNPGNLAVAAFVQDSESREVLQATALGVCEAKKS